MRARWRETTVTPLNPAILADARRIAHQVLDRGEPLDALYTIPVGEAFLYLSTDRNKVIGCDLIEIEGTTFVLGFRGSDCQS